MPAKPKKSADPQPTPNPAARPPAPGFKLPDQAGKIHNLSDYRGQWLVLYFYPKDDTPGCTTEACQFRDAYSQFTKQKVAVLGVSPDDEKSHAKFAGKFHLPFPLLADTDKSMVNAYGVWKEKSMYGRKYMGVERTTVLIDPQGRLAYRWEKVKVGGHDADVLAKLEELAAK